jgi:type IV pilus assembly protein PilX
MHRQIQLRSRQRGAALVVGLLLLVILTLLAISGMNSASTELIMAGNEQYRQKAFNAASAGIEQALVVLDTVKQDLKTPTTTAKTKVTGADADDSYVTSSQFMGVDENVPGFTAGRFAAFHYDITGTGTAVRQATSVQNQGAYLIQRTEAGTFGSITP